MEFYSNSKPNLIGTKINRTVYKIMKKEHSGGTISDKISNVIVSVYNKFISPNKFIVGIIIFTILFLVYRYYSKENKENKENKDKELEEFDDQLRIMEEGQLNNNIINEIMNEQTKHLTYDEQPSFNPLYSTQEQPNKVYYPPDPLPVNIPGTGITYTRSLYGQPKPFPGLNAPNYNYSNVYTNPSLSYYSGTYNTYHNAQDTDIINPLGYPTNFNTSTGEYMDQMTSANKQNIVDYQNILQNMNQDLVNSLKIGPNYLDNDNSEYEMQPPYANDM